MADRPMDQDEAALAVAARHAIHDEVLIVAFAGQDPELDDADRSRAQGFIERCTACHDLHRDLVAIMATIKASGTAAEVGAVRSAPRDFRLTPEMVGLARRPASVAGLLERILEAIRSFGRPMGASLAALGIVGILVGTMGIGSMPGALPLGADSGSAATAGAAPGATIDSSGSVPEVSPTDATIGVTEKPGEYSARSSGTTAGTWLFLGSVALLVLGILLIVIGTRGGRRGSRTE